MIQRVRALNLLIHDVYHDQKIVKSGVMPAEQIYLNAQYRPHMQGVKVALDNYCHISGVDIVRAGHGNISCSKTTCGCPRVFPTCSKAAK